jgi:hypothetical protein
MYAGASSAMIRLVVSTVFVCSTAGLNITTQEKFVWMEFPELLTVVRNMQSTQP